MWRALVLVGGCALVLGGSAGAGTGPRWRVFATRVPDLAAVDAPSSTNVWAVGDGIVHWDGRTLHVTPVPWKHATLVGVSALTSTDVWAVGSISAHWDGHCWRRVPLPGGHLWLADVVATAPDDVWAVGHQGAALSRPLVLHFDGSRWRRVRIPPALGELKAVDARAPDDIWAAGMDGDLREESYGYTDYVLHWDGRRWRRVPSPLEAEVNSGPYASAIDVGLTGEVWTLDYDFSGNGPSFVRWAGPQRLAHAFSWPSDDEYEDIAAISATDAWLVGNAVAHWNGSTWRVEHTPFERSTLRGVSAASPDDIWAVGNHLIARYGR
jgi:hypothetical protein